ncbi:SH3 domain-containing protein [Candidatus Tisiphia endosymbiont of Oplodontha viridula]|uniref:SH3 domain-containing protein n=1 Tax=Candidatus Tisiphia endosymbiont of Oplodontha viridula TaxID=3077925 RepID=UPI0035C8CBFD
MIKCIFYLLVLCSMTSCTLTTNKNRKIDPDVIQIFPLENYSQNINDWINKNNPDYDTPLLSPDIQKKHLQKLYEHNYGDLSPWDKQYVNQLLHKSTPNDIVTIIQNSLIEFGNKNKTGNAIAYGENFRPYTEDWIDTISSNINITQFYNLTYQANNRAIAIDNLHARLLPTNDVHFYSYKQAGQGYPFDNLQMSSIWAGTPLYIIGTTKDRAWSLVIAPDFIVWVKSSGIARTNAEFVNKWQMAAKSHLVAITRTQTAITDTTGQFLFYAYIGSIFPINNNSSTLSKELMIPSISNGYAVIKYAQVSNQNTVEMPLMVTQRNIANILSSLIGRPYGWGNLYFYNDCSAELKNFFATFGIWLPRQALDQSKYGRVVDMSAASPEQRISYLMENGKPFLTIIYIGGHIVMYIGNYPNSHNKESPLMAMSYQNIWGLRPAGVNTRIVVGGSVFLPLLLQYPEVPNIESLAAKKYFQVIYLDQVVD